MWHRNGTKIAFPFSYTRQGPCTPTAKVEKDLGTAGPFFHLKDKRSIRCISGYHDAVIYIKNISIYLAESLTVLPSYIAKMNCYPQCLPRPI